MTRDEAIEIWRRTYADIDASPVDVSGKAVDGFVELGMLKLDEPKNFVAQRLAELRQEYPGVRGFDWWIQSIQDAGLKIVKK